MDTLVRWGGQNCGHVYNAMVPPAECPNCGSPREQFNQLEGVPEGNVFVAEEHIPRHVKRWECDVCGHIALMDEPPAECPNCGSSKDHFHELESVL